MIHINLNALAPREHQRNMITVSMDEALALDGISSAED